MTVMIEPGLLAGAVTPPPSKSQAHRLLIARALAGENIDDPAHRADSQDIRATRDCLKSLREGEGKLPVLECGESGSTLRFLIPVALALRGGGVFRGRGRLMDRPQEPYFRIFDGMGITHRREGDSLTVRGRLRPGEYPLPGDVSSQFVTGLLFALPLLEGESIIRLTSPLESRGYVDMTLQVLRDRGIRHLKVVYSPEPAAETRQLEAPSPGRRSVPASVPWVPSTAGILMASAIVRDLIADSED